MIKGTMNIPEGLSVVPSKVREAKHTSENDPDALLTIDEVSKILKVPKSFLYAPCRRKGPDPIPCVKIGKYLRYYLRAVMEWIERHKEVLN